MSQIGFVGLGDMGGPMAKHLLDDGFDLTVYGRGDGLDAVRAAGADVVDSYPAVARAADVIVLCLPGPDTVEAVVFGDGGLLEGLQPGTVVVDTTTSLPGLTDELDDRLRTADGAALSAPISGGRASAEAGTLSVMASGSPDAFDEVEPVLEAFSSNVFYVGERPSQGHVLKLVNNFLSFTALLATSEGLAIGQQAGLDLETMLEVINESSGRNHATMNQFPQRIVSGTYDTGFPLVLLEKDMRLFTKFAESMAVPVLFGNTTRSMIGFARSHQGDYADMTRVYDFFVEMMARDG